MLKLSTVVICTACIGSLVTGLVYRSSTCYGTNLEDHVNVSCSEGVIYLADILTGAKPLSLNCPAYNHHEATLDPVEKDRCCNYNSSDCMTSYSGSWEYFMEKCNGQANCSGVQTIFQMTNVSCPSGLYPQFTNYMTLVYECIPDGHIHGACNTTDDCLDNHALCPEGFCECQDLYTEYDDQCWEDGALNGSCTTDQDCDDQYTYCEQNSRCGCLDGYSSIEGTCIQDGTISGACLASSTCLDSNATCESNICRCKNGYSVINGICYKDGTISGVCLTGSPQCIDDNAVCESDICRCMDGYTAIDGVCRQDGTISGACLASSKCLDSNAICESNRCRCKDGYSEYNGICYQDGYIHGSCNADSDCSDQFAFCAGNQRCACVTGYSEVNGACIQDGTISGVCLASSTCLDSNAICETDICRCKDGYSEYNGICYKDGDIYGSCNADSDCSDTFASCTGSQRCACVTGYTEIDGTCIQDGTISGACLSSFTCIDSNANCVLDRCLCKNGYSEYNAVCYKDGDIYGSCSTDSDCTVEFAFCGGNQRCACTTGFSEANGVCIKDGTVPGACLASSTCITENAICEADRCRCKNGYSEIDGLCKLDGTIPGACLEDSTCLDTINAICESDRCRCKNGYSVIDGTCWQDGGFNGNCSTTTNCHDDNTYCHGNGRCACVTGYTYVNGGCIEDGTLGGVCMAGYICKDPHTICIDGLCRCNELKHYVIIDGQCQRDDNQLNGPCSQTTCQDINAACTDGYCTCKDSYNEVNGVCKEATSPSVTSCNGEHPYNKTEADCRQTEIALILGEYDVTKRSATSCPIELTSFDTSTFEQCCTEGVDDCITPVGQSSSCRPPGQYLSAPNYRRVDYICIPDGNPIIDIDDDRGGNGNGVVVTSPGYPGNGVTSHPGSKTCSIQTSCDTTIKAQLALLALDQGTGTCQHRIDIEDGDSTTSYTCTDNNDMTSYFQLQYESNKPYIVVRLTSETSGSLGKFVFKFEGTDAMASLTVGCGTDFNPYDETDQLPSCAATESDGQDNTKVIILGIVLAFLLLVVLAIIFFCCKDKIKRKFCPQKDPEKVEPIIFHESLVVETTPMNTKFPGRPDLVKGIPPPAALAPPLPPVVMDTTPMRTKFQRRVTDVLGQKPPLKRQMTLADHLRKEQIEYDQEVKERNLSRTDSFTLPVSSGADWAVAGGPPVTMVPMPLHGAQTHEHGESEKKKKKKKKRKKIKLPKLRSASIGVFAATKGFDLQRTRSSMRQNENGVYRSHGDDLQQTQTTGPRYMADVNGTVHPVPSTVLPFDSRSTWQRAGRTAVPGSHSGANVRLPGPPPLQRHAPFGHEPRAFDPKGAWRRAGNLSSIVATPNVMRRKATVEITAIDDPDTIECSEFDMV